MRKILLSAAVALGALTAAAPASAQYYPQPGYGYGYGHNSGYGQHGLIRSYMIRVDQLRQRIEVLDRRDRISEREAHSLRNEARWLQDRVRQASYNGLNWRERRDIEYRLARLEQRIRYERRDGNDWRYGNPGYGNDGSWGYRDWDNDGRLDRNDPWIDRDRDGRDDRREDDRGRYPG